ncbi:integumentary mucin C.1-like [Zalophus californianus]|uniref:Integumentary mucin C.1-like n=1 Tax=Zalophus californianus TaxID=9704 RepID=A0A6J2D704_ZALCA|nr:integumentary mucin C.1-like [Zalophus californianus]
MESTTSAPSGSSTAVAGNTTAADTTSAATTTEAPASTTSAAQTTTRLKSSTDASSDSSTAGGFTGITTTYDEITEDSDIDEDTTEAPDTKTSAAPTGLLKCKST